MTRPGRKPGTPMPPAVRAKISAAAQAYWATRRATKPPRKPPPKGEQPYVPPKAREAAEIARQAAAFDEHQRHMAAEATPGPFVPRETRPSRERGEACPVNPQRIPIVDNTPTAATVFDRFVEEPQRGGGRWWGDGDAR